MKRVFLSYISPHIGLKTCRTCVVILLKLITFPSFSAKEPAGITQMSRQMTANKNTFRSLQEKEGTIMFGNDNSSKILGKGTISLGSKDESTKNVLL